MLHICKGLSPQTIWLISLSATAVVVITQHDSNHWHFWWKISAGILPPDSPAAASAGNVWPEPWTVQWFHSWIMWQLQHDPNQPSAEWDWPGMVTNKFWSELPTLNKWLDSSLVPFLAHDFFDGPGQRRAFWADSEPFVDTGCLVVIRGNYLGFRS